MVDPITGWFEITKSNFLNDNSELIRNNMANQVSQANLNHV